MIGTTMSAANAAMPGPAPASAPQAGARDADAAPARGADAAAHGDAGPNAAARANAGERRMADRAGRRDDDARLDPSDGRAAGRGFAELLSGGDAVDAIAKTTKPSVDAGPTPADAPASLPDQLLALLAGQPVAASLPTDSASAATPSTPSTPTAHGGRPVPMPLAANAGPVANAADAAIRAAAPAGDDPSAALMALVRDAAATAADGGAPTAAANDPLQVQSAASAPAPGALHARGAVPVPGAPLQMPAQPDAGFDDGFGARIAWVAEQRLGHAEIRLNPEHVGPIEVRVHLDGTRVDAEFHSAHAEVRQAIEASVPRLRELLGQQGLQLGQAGVGAQHAWQDRSARADTPVPDGDASAQTAPATAPATLPLRSRRLLDEYA